MEYTDSFSPASSNNIVPTWFYDTNNSWTKADISDDGGTVIAADDKVLKVFKSSSNNTAWWFNATEQIFTLSTCKNGSLIVIGTALGDGIVSTFSDSGNATLWQYNTSGWVFDVEMSADGSTIAVADWDGWVYLFDSSSNETLWTYKSPESILDVALSYDGNTIIAGGKNNTVYVFNRDSNETLWTYRMDKWVYGVDVSADGNRLVASCENRILTFNRASNSTLWAYSGHDFHRTIISSDGSKIACGASSAVQPNNLYVFDFSSNHTLWTFNTTDQVLELDFTWNASHLIAGSYNHHFYVFSGTNNQTLLDYQMPGYVWSVGITLNGTQFVCGAENKTVYFELMRPQVTQASTSRSIYNTNEAIVIEAQAVPGTLSLFGAYVNYSINNGYFLIVKMNNLTLLSDSLVHFSVSIGPFIEGNVTYRIWCNDTFALSAASPTHIINIDGTPPELHSLDQTPTSPNSTQSVEVLANITDAMSGVDRVLLNYSINNGTTWTVIEMSINTYGFYTASIPSQDNGTMVLYYLVAFDCVNNSLIIDNTGPNFKYFVLDPSSPTTTTTGTTTTTTTTTSPTTSTGSTTQPPLDNPLLLPILLGLGVGLFIVIVLLVRHVFLSRTVAKTHLPKVDTPPTEGMK
ncbi:MAG: WD40 repeat domain-containing protein [Candidatus Thorarchaeota archaeon]